MSHQPHRTAIDGRAPHAPVSEVSADAPGLHGIDRALRLIAHALNAPLVLVARTDDRQQVVECRSRLFDAWAAVEGTPAVRALAEHAARSVAMRLTGWLGSGAAAPLVRGRYGLADVGPVEYGTTALAMGGTMAGVLCIADRRRRAWGDRHEQMLRDFAGVMASEIERLELRSRLAPSVAEFGRCPGRDGSTDGAAEMTVVLGADGTVIYGSPAGERLLGYAPGERVGRNAFELVHPDDVGHVVAAFAQAVQRPGSAVHVTYRYRHKDGSWRTLASTGTSLTRDPIAGGIVVHSRDVTGRRGADDQLRRAPGRVVRARTRRAALT